MKACLMKVNYDPKYTSPHCHKPYQSLHVRLTVTKDIYAHGAKNKKKEQAEEIHRSKLFSRNDDRIPPIEDSQQTGSCDCAKTTPNFVKKADVKKTKVQCRPTDSGNSNCERYKSPYVKSHQVPLEPVKSFLGQPKFHSNKTRSSRSHPEFPQELDKPSVKSSFVRHQTVLERTQILGRRSEHTIDVSTVPYDRSRTVLSSDLVKDRSPEMIMLERKARVEADRAVRNKKVFTILGPYNGLRNALRRRGWVEKFHNLPNTKDKASSKRKPSTGQSVVIDENEDPSFSTNSPPTVKDKMRPWEEEKGFYALMSGAVKNNQPSFLFTVKSTDVDSKVVHNGQMVNHFGKSRSLTTKVGLCQALRHLSWYTTTDANSFYPQCFNLNDVEEREMFIDEYRLMACIGILRQCILTQDSEVTECFDTAKPNDSDNTSPDVRIPCARQKHFKRILDFAFTQCCYYLQDMAHSFIDEGHSTNVTRCDEWDEFLCGYYKILKQNLSFKCFIPQEDVDSYVQVLDQIKEIRPQFIFEGSRNWWILKPGAKSRGRGIQCMDNLEQIIGFIENESSLVAQKYIERPLLICNTKFDIRQWFLVTDWNPLTVWLYKDYYLRFCSQQYTLDTFDPSVHLSNNSIQKKFLNEHSDHEVLPPDKMWLHTEFEEYLRTSGKVEEYEAKVVPGMKNAIICCLLCAQEHVEERKNAFELYGADFVLTEDFQPWLLEINSSPSMAKSSKATSKLVDLVLEDMLKVVLDRRIDKNCDTGGFYLIHKQPTVSDPPHLDHMLSVSGKKMKTKVKNKLH